MERSPIAYAGNEYVPNPKYGVHYDQGFHLDNAG